MSFRTGEGRLPTIKEGVDFLAKKKKITGSSFENKVLRSLSNYLQVFFQPHQSFTESILESFFSQALYYQYWQENLRELETVVTRLLQGFVPSDFTPLRKTRQVIAIQNQENLLSFLRRKILPTKGERRALVPFEEGVLVLLLSPHGGLRVRHYPKEVMLMDGDLELIGPRLSLVYDEHLELSARHEQMMSVSFMDFYRFRHQGGLVEGIRFTGYEFSKKYLFQEPLYKEVDLFYALKSVERHFINPQSDPFYHELITQMEKAQKLLRDRHVDAHVVASQVLKQAHMAYKKAFPQDRLLHLMICQLEAQLKTPTTLMPSVSS
ncbi:MAG: hypothetical protein D6797_02085 [Bdellovibrio sp.]|nr:MAG: hypothetical protein D6797_02085 [Bdellovibrio sp.]